jgi:hypothetical protein
MEKSNKMVPSWSWQLDQLELFSFGADQSKAGHLFN